MAPTTRLALAAAVMTAMIAGCNNSPYVVVEQLPPPTTPADPVVAAALVETPAAEADIDEPVEQPAPADAVPDGWVPGGMEQVWRYIVIHHSATATGNAAQFDIIHREQRGWDELGYHFVITNGDGGPDGNVEIGPRWHKQKWGAHCGGTPDNVYNDLGIGICLVGDFTDHMPSDEQMAAMIRLVSFLVSRYDIRIDDIISHRDAPAAITACPGQQLHAYIRSRLAEQLGGETSTTGGPQPPASLVTPES